jgi:hypothetical protein
VTGKLCRLWLIFLFYVRIDSSIRTRFVTHPLVSVLVVVYWMVPESVRWLIGAGRVKEAKYIIAKAARVNERDNPAHLFKATTIASSGLENTAHSESIEVKTTILDLFRITNMSLRACNMCFQVNLLIFLLAHN